MATIADRLKNQKTKIKRITGHFSTKESYFDLFKENDARVEGWFKGELISLFNDLKEEEIISTYECEKSIEGKRTKIDFIINDGADYYIELKTLSIGQKKTSRSLSFYFQHKDCIKKDISKLKSIKHRNCYKWIIAFVYPRPDEDEWNKQFKKIAGDVELLTKPNEFIDKEYYIAVMKVGKK